MEFKSGPTPLNPDPSSLAVFVFFVVSALRALRALCGSKYVLCSMLYVLLGYAQHNFSDMLA